MWEIKAERKEREGDPCTAQIRRAWLFQGRSNYPNLRDGEPGLAIVRRFKGYYLSEHSQHLKGRYGYNQFADEGTAAERSLNKLLKATQLITDKTEVPPKSFDCVFFALSTLHLSCQEADPRARVDLSGKASDGSFLP